jgi:hypothetical protein
MVVNMRGNILWDMIPRSLVEIYRCIGRTNFMLRQPEQANAKRISTAYPECSSKTGHRKCNAASFSPSLEKLY